MSELALRLLWTVFMVLCQSSLEGQCCKPSRVICSAGALRGAGPADALRQACASCTAASRLVWPLHSAEDVASARVSGEAQGPKCPVRCSTAQGDQQECAPTPLWQNALGDTHS